VVIGIKDIIFVRIEGQRNNATILVLSGNDFERLHRPFEKLNDRKNFSLALSTCGRAAASLGPTKALHVHIEHKC